MTRTTFVLFALLGLLAAHAGCSNRPEPSTTMYERLKMADDIQGLCSDGLLEEYSQVGFKIRCDGSGRTVRFFVWRYCAVCAEGPEFHGHWVEVFEVPSHDHSDEAGIRL